MKKRNRRAVIFLIILNTFLILFAIAILIVLLVGDFYWKVDLYYDLLDAKGLEGVYLVYYLTASLAIVVGILALVTVCVKRKTLGRVYAGFAIVICCGINFWLHFPTLISTSTHTTPPPHHATSRTPPPAK